MSRVPRTLLILFTLFFQSTTASPRPALPSITATPEFNASSKAHHRRADDESVTQVSTCGYKNGDASLSRTANSGFDCRVDTANGLWGFCPTTVIVASDCGLAGACIDLGLCSDGCGLLGTSSITTFTCTDSGGSFCSTALLVDGPDQTYSYLACGTAEIVDTLLVAATTTDEPSTSSSKSSPESTASSSPTSIPTLTSSPTSTSGEVYGTFSTSSSIAASSQTTAGSSPSDYSSSSSFNIGAIVGGVLGGCALIVFIAFGFICLRLKKRSMDNRFSTVQDAGITVTSDSSSPSSTDGSSGLWSSFKRSWQVSKDRTKRLGDDVSMGHEGNAQRRMLMQGRRGSLGRETFEMDGCDPRHHEPVELPS